MSFDKLDVSSVALLNELVSGSFFKVPGGFTVAPDIDWVPASEPTAIDLGFIGPDGLNVEVSADDNDKLVWNGNLGKIYSNLLVTTTVQFASNNADTYSVLVGESNVSTTSAGATKALFKLEQPTEDGYIVLGKLDDGRKLHWVITAGRVDPNVSFTLVNTDITLYDADILASSGDSYILVEPVSSVSV